mgnify:FL=1
MPRPIVSAVFSAGVRGIGCVLFAAHGDCTVTSCRLPSLRGAFLLFKESAVCVGDKFGSWPLDD